MITGRLGDSAWDLVEEQELAKEYEGVTKFNLGLYIFLPNAQFRANRKRNAMVSVSRRPSQKQQLL